MLKLVIFDMDGVLIDSELYWKQFEKELYPTIGVPFTEEVKAKVMGLKIGDIVSYLQQEHDPTITEERVRVLYDELAKKVYAHATVMPGVEALLQELHVANIPSVIGSSATAAMIHSALENSRLSAYFTATHSADAMGVPGKPDPAIYQKIMNEMSVSPKETVIIEDSIHGYQAAVASNARVIATTDPRWCDMSADYSNADLHVQSLKGVTLKNLESLIRS